MNTQVHATFVKILKLCTLTAVLILIIGGVVGFLLLGVDGIWNAIAAVVLTYFFAAVTVLSVILASHLDTTFFMAVILGSWALKFLVFIGGVALVKTMPFYNGPFLFVLCVVGILTMVLIDAWVIFRGRVLNVSDVTLPAPAATDEASGK